MAEKLTTKQRLFVEAYLANPNGVQAAKTAGYKGNDKTLSVVAAENLAKPCISSLLDQRVQEAIVTADEVLTNIKNLANGSERDADRIKAWELLGKYLKLFTDKTEHSGQVGLYITDDSE